MAAVQTPEARQRVRYTAPEHSAIDLGPAAPALQGTEPESERWARLAAKYLPLQGPDDSNWRFSRAVRPDEPSQGWKLHVSATVLSAADVLEACAPYLLEHDILFKASSDLRILARLNAGIFYGFSQVGKFITVYPNTARDAVQIAGELDRRTQGFGGPRVPFDLPYRPGGNVYYRYGGFRVIEIVDPNGVRATAIRDPKGKLWTDRREPGSAFPDWLTNPFATYEEPVAQELRTDFLVYDALSQRGKGGVYHAVDIRTIPARRCIVKEGRRHGETARDGSDGYTLVEQEESVLRSLRAARIPVPEVLGAFHLPGYRYLALEYIEGVNLMALTSHPRVKLPLVTADSFAARVARLLANIHAAGWVWRDLKPLNVIVTPDGELRPIDFEGSVAISNPSSLPWGTPGYTPPESKQGPVTGSNLPEDVYALGVTIYQIYTSFVPMRLSGADDPTSRPLLPVGVRRKGIDPGTRALIHALLDTDPMGRPSAADAASELEKREADDDLHWRVVRRRSRPVVPDQPAEPAMPGAERVVLHNDRPLEAVAG